MNPRWIQTTVASVLLAILLKAGLHVPILSTLITIGIIFSMQIVMTNLAGGVMTTWGRIRQAGNVGLGVVIFLAIRFIAAKVLGLYPIDTYRANDDAGGLFGILPSHDISKVILWEILFAMVAGQITVMWVNGTHKNPVRAIILSSFFILSFQLGFPSYAKTWPNREAVSTNLVRHGVVGTAAIGTWRLAFGGPDEAQSTPAPAMAKSGRTEEALVLTYQGITPCHAPVGWSYKVRTDGHPLRIKYQGCDWFTQPAEGNFEAPKGFEPGEAQFESPDPQNQHVIVQVYKIVQVQVR